MSSKRASTLAGAAALAVVAAGCYVTTVYATESPSPAAAGTPEKIDSKVIGEGDDHIVIELKDKRRVSLKYADGKGLVERHRAAGGGDWSAPRTVHKTKTEHCQGIDARAHGGTVTVTADWGLYCSDGEPPQESVAAVGTGHLTAWDTDLTEGFDGWPPAKIYDGGDEVRFVDKRWDGTTTLTWKKGKGFGEPSDVYKPIPEHLVGSWEAEDGSSRVTFQQTSEGKRPSATVETLKGAQCVGSGPVTEKSDDSVELRDFTVEKGKETKNCPPELYETFFTAPDADGPLKLMELGDPPKPLLSYERTDGKG
ncbi:hypothetical protein [Streptomyces nanshensis]|uniref:hypothetical protein n=1 Tax=Streptomyces nanshensis TaxID=518642 RepID=UPI00085C9C15|nr:hypothetical protein [Streptomyces nanshensis]